MALPFMEAITRINEIASRGAVIRLPLSELCGRAPGVVYSTVHRWVTVADANPRARQLDDAVSKLESVVAAEERRLYDHLVALHPDWPVGEAMREAAE